MDIYIYVFSSITTNVHGPCDPRPGNHPQVQEGDRVSQKDILFVELYHCYGHSRSAMAGHCDGKSYQPSYHQ